MSCSLKIKINGLFGEASFNSGNCQIVSFTEKRIILHCERFKYGHIFGDEVNILDRLQYRENRLPDQSRVDEITAHIDAHDSGDFLAVKPLRSEITYRVNGYH